MLTKSVPAHTRSEKINSLRRKFERSRTASDRDVYKNNTKKKTPPLERQNVNNHKNLLKDAESGIHINLIKIRLNSTKKSFFDFRAKCFNVVLEI